MTYRLKLHLYVGVLVVLLAGVTALLFKTANDVVVNSTEEHLRHIAARDAAAVGAELREFERYAEIIAGDPRLQQHIHSVLELGAGADRLATYYNRQYAALPADYCLIISSRGDVLLGKEHLILVEELRRNAGVSEEQNVYFVTAQGLAVLIARPVFYQGRRLATVVVGRLLDQTWLARQEARSRHYLLFFERQGRVLWSSNIRYQGLTMRAGTRRLDVGDDYFRLREVSYGAPRPDLPRLWAGASESHLSQQLTSYRHWIYVLTVLGCVVMLFIGRLVLGAFDKPMKALMLTTEQMIKGELPVIVRSEAKTEMDKLLNRFADVLDALRREQTKLDRANRKLLETAITDSLTGLYNRRYLLEVAPGLFAQVVRDKRYLSAVLLDLDFFKAVNDSHGHLGGDAVLVHFARLLKHNSRANDYLFRIGGEEFLLLNVTEDPYDSVALANKIRGMVQDSPANYRGTLIQITVSAGVSCCHGESGDISLSALLRAADTALYDAKAAGRNRVTQHASCLVAKKLNKPPASLARAADVAREPVDS